MSKITRIKRYLSVSRILNKKKIYHTGRFLLGRQFRTQLILATVISMLFMSVVSIFSVSANDNITNDLTRYDAEANLLGFMPNIDSGLNSPPYINEYPNKMLIANYEGGTDPHSSRARVQFQIGDWKFLGRRGETDEYQLDNETKLIKSEFWFETDIISWTELDYDDVFSTPQLPYEIQNSFKWLEMKKLHSYGWGGMNSMTRITAWNDDLNKIYQEVGQYPQNYQLEKWVSIWPLSGKPYRYMDGLKHLLKNPINYMPRYYNKYIRWNQLLFPGNPKNLRDYSLTEFNDLKVDGDLYLQVDLQRSLWDRIKFPDTVEVLDNNTGNPIGKYNKHQVHFSIDSGLLVGPNDPNHPDSRTRVVDLQDLYDNDVQNNVTPTSDIGVMLSGNNWNQPTSVETNAIDKLDELKDPRKIRSEIPDDVIGDGVTMLKIVDKTANWRWHYKDVLQGPNARLMGTKAMEPYIWENEVQPDQISQTDLEAIKPLAAATTQDIFNGIPIKDRSTAIFAVPFKYGPKLEISYATLEIEKISLTVAAQLFGDYAQYLSSTGIKEMDHIPYSANVRNIGACQTIRVNVIALSTYDYEPYAATDDDLVTPDFPHDDSSVEWPDKVEDGGDINFTNYEQYPDPLDAFIGFVQDLISSFGGFGLILIIALIGISLIVLIPIYRAISGRGIKSALKKLERFQRIKLANHTMNRLNPNLYDGNTIGYIEAAQKPYSTKIVAVAFTALCVFVVIFTSITWVIIY